MLKVIRNLLLKIVDNIDAGNSNITEEEAVKIVDSLKRFTDKEKRLSKYAACEHLNISRFVRDIEEYFLHLLQLLMYMLQSTLSTMTMQNCLRTGLVMV